MQIAELVGAGVNADPKCSCQWQREYQSTSHGRYESGKLRGACPSSGAASELRRRALDLIAPLSVTCCSRIFHTTSRQVLINTAALARWPERPGCLSLFNGLKNLDKLLKQFCRPKRVRPPG